MGCIMIITGFWAHRMAMICFVDSMIVRSLFMLFSVFRPTFRAFSLRSIINTIRIEETHSPIMITVDMDGAIGIIRVLGLSLIHI